MAETWREKRLKEIQQARESRRQESIQQTEESFRTRRLSELQQETSKYDNARNRAKGSKERVGELLSEYEALSPSASTSKYDNVRNRKFIEYKPDVETTSLKPETTRHIQNMQEKRLSPDSFNTPSKPIVNRADQLKAALNLTSPKPTSLPTFQQQIGNIQDLVGTGEKLKSKGLANATARGLGNVLDALTFGATDKLTDQFVNYIGDVSGPTKVPVNEKRQQVADFVSGSIGSLGTGAGAYRAAGALGRPLINKLPGLAESAVKPIASRLTPTAGAITRVGAQSAGKAAGVGLTGGLAGTLYQAPIEAIEELRNPSKQTLSQHLGDIGTSALVGGAADVALGALAGGVGQYTQKIAEEIGKRDLGYQRAVEELGEQGARAEVGKRNLADIDEQIDSLRRSNAPDRQTQLDSLTNERNSVVDFIKQNEPDFEAPSIETPIFKANETPASAQRQPIKYRPDSALTRNVVNEQAPPTGTNEIPAPAPAGTGTQPRFAERVSESTPTNLADAIRSQKLTAPTTTHADMIERAASMVERLGEEGMVSRILNKIGSLSDAENVAAQTLIKKLANSGSPEDLQTSIDLVSKVGRSGREMGQAINALKLWDRLDTAGIMRMAERQLNKGTAEGAKRIKPTSAQVKPLMEIADKLKVVESANNATRHVMSILASKKPGEALTVAERAIVSDYQKSMREAGEILRPLQAKMKQQRAKTIIDTEKVAPQKRTRDEVVDYLNALADSAIEELKRQRNVGIVAGGKNPIIQYAKIGAAKVAQGFVKFADWAAEMRKSGVTDKLGEVFQKSVERYRKESGVPTDEQINRIVNNALKKNAVDTETADAIRALGAEVGFYNGNVRKELMQDLHMTLNNLSKPSLAEYPASLQRISMLSTPVTQIKNILGNTGEYAMRKASDAAILPVDWARSKITGTDRQIRFKTNNPEKFWRNYLEGTKAGWKGVTPNGEFNNELIRPSTFKGKYNPLTYLEKSLGAVMQGPDHAFARQAYGESLGTFATNLGKSKGMTNKEIQQNFEALADELDANIFKMADEAAEHATFQNNTNLGTATSSIKKGLNKLTGSEKFGVGNVVIPFAKTPAAVIMRAFDYSPLGILRAGYNLLPVAGLEKGAIRQRAVQQALGRAIVGSTGLTGMGAYLASNGILTGAEPYDARRSGLEEAEGRGPFKLNWNALQRFIKSGFDKDAAQWQKGDKLVDYNWFQPASISVAMGAEFADALGKNRDANTSKAARTAKALQQAIVGGAGGALLDSPLASGLKDAVSIVGREGLDKGAAEDIAVNGLSQFIPAILNRARMAENNQRRETFGGTFGEKLGNMALNKVPGLSEKLPQSFGTFGQERTYMSGQPGVTGRTLNAALNPAATTTYAPTAETEAVKRLYESTKDVAVLPKKASKTPSLRFPGEKNYSRYNLNNEQYSEYSKELGQETSMRIREKLKLLNSSASDEDKTTAMKNLITTADKVVRDRLAKKWGKR